MTKIEWSTVIAETDGRVSLHRLRKFSTIAAFWLAIVVVIIGTLIQVITKVDMPTEMILILVGALVLPITGGQVSDAILQTRRSKRILAGEAPGRRASDRAV